MLHQRKIRTTTGRGRLFDSILDTVGDTPVIRVNNLGPGHATIYVKAEFFNPAASVKDRPSGAPRATTCGDENTSRRRQLFFAAVQASL